MKKLLRYIVAGTVAFLLSCSQREEGAGERNNPCDPGGTAWTMNAEPEITGSIDSGWADYNFTDSTGAVRLHVSVTDRNMPYDTLLVTVVVTTESGLVSRYTTTESILLIDHLKRGTSYSCSLLVTDKKAGSDVYVLSSHAPLVVPLPRPQPFISSSSYYVTISWNIVPGAEEYRVYTSAALKGPYVITYHPLQSASGSVVVVDTPAGYAPRYYLIAAANKTSESFARDTLTGRRFYEGISTPSISSVSQGTYADYIQVSVYNSYYYSSDPYRYEVYRSIGDTMSFELVGTAIQSYSGSTYQTYNDSVTTTVNCYYRVVAVDNTGRGSRWSSIMYGYIRRLYAPSSFYVSPNSMYIGLSWYAVTGAAGYKIFRSKNSCSDTMSLLATTTAFVYNDSVSTSDYYYYKVCAVDTAGREGTMSSCGSGRVVLLAAPYSLQASNGTYLRYIRLSWNTVTGASGYIVYRSKTTGSMVPIDTVATISYQDTVPDASLYYYTVAAFNTRGVGTVSSYVGGAVMQPPTLSASLSSQSVYLYWSSASASYYYIYRSSPDSTNFVCIDSTTQTSYSDTLHDYQRYYYRLAMRTTQGLTGQGNIVGVKKPFAAPAGFTISELDNGVRLTWNRVPGADRYQIYRSTTSSSAQTYLQVVDTTYFDSLVAGSRYWYSVAGSIGGQLTPATSALSGGTVNIPLAPINVSVTGTSSGITITWQVSASSSAATGYCVYRATASSGTFVMLDSIISRTYTDSVSDSTYYYYKVTAYNSKGTGPGSAVYGGRLLTPPYPSTVLVSQGRYAGKIVVSWSAVASVTGYRCYRATSSSGSYSLIATTADLLIADSTCTPNVLYYYCVSSYRLTLSGLIGPSNVGMRLGPPSSVSVTSATTGIRVTWSAASYPAPKYYVYRSNSAAGTFVKIDSATTTSYIDARPLSGDNCYKVSAVNFDETPLSPPSPVIGQSGLVAPAMVNASQGTESGKIVVTWSTTPSGSTGYNLYRSSSASFGAGVVLRTTGATTVFNDTVSSDSIYYYRVKTTNGTALSSYSDTIARGFRYPSTVPPAPGGLVTESGSVVLLVWEPPQSTATGYTGFRVYRALSQGGSESLVVSTGGTSYRDTPPQSNPTVYWYRVVTYNQRGESVSTGWVSGSRD